LVLSDFDAAALNILVKMERIIKTHRNFVLRSTTICHTFASAHFHWFLP
jgi:hypothetical protein